MSKRNKKVHNTPQKATKKNINSATFKYFQDIKQFEVLFILFSIVLSTYLINITVDKLSDRLPVSDETTTIRHITGGIEETGYPYLMPPKSSPNYNPEYDYTKYHSEANPRTYLVECYMRYVGFKLSDYISVNWYSFSSLMYLYLIFLCFLVYTFLVKEKNISIPMIGVFFILIASSSWTSTSFHYVRYYPFLLMFYAVSLIINSSIFSNENLNIYTKSILLVIIGYLPVEAHPQGYFSLFFWLGVATYIISKNALKNWNNKRYRYISIGVLALLLIILFLNKSQILRGISWIKGYDETIAIMKVFLELNFNTSTFGIIFTAIIFILGIYSFRYLHKKEKDAIILAILLFIPSLLASSAIMGARFTGYNGSNRYHFFAHVIYLFILSGLFVAVFRMLQSKFHNVKYNYLFIFVLILPIVTNIYKLTILNTEDYNFSILPKLSISKFKEAEKEMKNIDFVVLSNDGSIYSAFWHKKIYRLTTQNSLKEILLNHPDEYLYFYLLNTSMVEPKLYAKLVQIHGFSPNGSVIHSSTLKPLVNAN